MSKEYVLNPKAPLALFTMRDGKPHEEKCFACGECGQVYASKDSALSCHKASVCTKCNKQTEKYWVLCSQCRDFERWESAVEIKEHDGWVFDEHSERFFSTYEEAVEYFQEIVEAGDGDSVPEWLHPCYEEKFPGLDLDGAIESMCDDMFEDAYDHLIGLDELELAVKKFNERNKLNVSYQYDHKKKIKLIL